MPLGGTGTAWGNTIADAIIAANDPDNELSASEKEQIRAGWRVVKTEDASHIPAESDIVTTTSSTGSTAVGPPGGPLPIAALPGSGTGDLL